MELGIRACEVGVLKVLCWHYWRREMSEIVDHEANKGYVVVLFGF